MAKPTSRSLTNTHSRGGVQERGTRRCWSSYISAHHIWSSRSCQPSAHRSSPPP